jgi:hypothetical protein
LRPTEKLPIGLKQNGNKSVSKKQRIKNLMSRGVRVEFFEPCISVIPPNPQIYADYIAALRLKAEKKVAQ